MLDGGEDLPSWSLHGYVQCLWKMKAADLGVILKSTPEQPLFFTGWSIINSLISQTLPHMNYVGQCARMEEGRRNQDEPSLPLP